MDQQEHKSVAFSVNYLDPLLKNGLDYNVITHGDNVHCLTDFVTLFIEFLTKIGYEKKRVMELLYSISSITEEGDMREELTDVLLSIEEEIESRR